MFSFELIAWSTSYSSCQQKRTGENETKNIAGKLLESHSFVLDNVGPINSLIKLLSGFGPFTLRSLNSVVFGTLSAQNATSFLIASHKPE